MNRFAARRARVIAARLLEYRAWSVDPSNAEIPPISVLSDPRLHSLEHERVLRRAQNGVFDSAVRHVEPVLRRVS
ncbi:MAG: hypothetical protein DI534_13530 [Leifsonia xyli]|nr:MAG: hypothetical protein DI534_13530 [Leifsonia xyli]